MLKYDKTYYRRNILISIIISEILVISAFVLSPRESTHNTKIIISDPVILYDDIPQTIQRSAEPAPPPQIPPIIFSEEIEAYQTTRRCGCNSKCRRKMAKNLLMTIRAIITFNMSGQLRGYCMRLFLPEEKTITMAVFSFH